VLASQGGFEAPAPWFPAASRPRDGAARRQAGGGLHLGGVRGVVHAAELGPGPRQTGARPRPARLSRVALGSTLDLDQLLELILHRITDLCEADRATLYLLDERRKKLVSRIVIGEETRSIELELGDGIAGSVAKTGRPLRVKDAYKDKRFRREWDELTGYRTRSILAVPMKNHVGRTIGVIQVLNKNPDVGAKKGVYGEFSDGDEELLAALATQAAVSIDNSRLFLSVIHKNMQLVETKEQLEHRVADLKLLFDLESSMGRAGTVEELAWAVLKEAGRACEARAAALLIDEEDAGAWIYLLQVRDGRGTRPSDVVRLPHRRGGDGALGHALQAGEAVSLSARTPGTARGGAPTLEGEVSGRLADKFGHPIESVIAVPLEGEDAATVGAMALYNSKKGAFTDAQELVVLRDAVGAARRAGLDLARVGGDREVGDEGVLGLARAVRDDRAVAVAARHADGRGSR
jgi:GAF domain-containing protein